LTTPISLRAPCFLGARHRECIADDGPDDQTVRCRCRAVADTKIDLEIADLAEAGAIAETLTIGSTINP
jgi:hypothetical protein